MDFLILGITSILKLIALLAGGIALFVIFATLVGFIEFTIETTLRKKR